MFFCTVMPCWHSCNVISSVGFFAIGVARRHSPRVRLLQYFLAAAQVFVYCLILLELRAVISDARSLRSYYGAR